VLLLLLLLLLLLCHPLRWHARGTTSNVRRLHLRLVRHLHLLLSRWHLVPLLLLRRHGKLLLMLLRQRGLLERHGICGLHTLLLLQHSLLHTLRRRLLLLCLRERISSGLCGLWRRSHGERTSLAATTTIGHLRRLWRCRWGARRRGSCRHTSTTTCTVTSGWYSRRHGHRCGILLHELLRRRRRLLRIRVLCRWRLNVLLLWLRLRGGLRLRLLLLLLLHVLLLLLLLLHVLLLLLRRLLLRVTVSLLLLRHLLLLLLLHVSLLLWRVLRRLLWRVLRRLLLHGQLLL
jgi:hypothetical protein